MRVQVICGFAGHERSDVHRYSPQASTWTQCEAAEEGLRPRSVFPVGTLPGGGAVIVGGEVEPSEVGHSGAGGFANDVVLVFPGGADARKTLTATVTSSSEVPCPRGWGSMCPAPTALAPSAENGAAFVMFGGLTGDDENPTRLDDTWLVTVTCA